MNRLTKFLYENKKLLRFIIIFLLAALVALLALNTNKDLLPFIYMIF